MPVKTVALDSLYHAILMALDQVGWIGNIDIIADFESLGGGENFFVAVSLGRDDRGLAYFREYDFKTQGAGLYVEGMVGILRGIGDRIASGEDD